MSAMKKTLFILAFIFAIIAFTVASASTGQSENISHSKLYSESVGLINQTFCLPTSVEVIEDEAFEGTSIMYITLPDRITTIGEQAFANITTLQAVRISMTTTSIAKTAFSGSNQVMITADPNSYARKWARENRIPFSPITVMYAGIRTQGTTASFSSVSKEILDTETTETEATNRTWRKIEDIKVRKTIEIIANVVQNRAPPMA